MTPPIIGTLNPYLLAEDVDEVLVDVVGVLRLSLTLPLEGVRGVVGTVGLVVGFVLDEVLEVVVGLVLPLVVLGAVGFVDDDPPLFAPPSLGALPLSPPSLGGLLDDILKAASLLALLSL